jgi:hypothetical protein
MHHLSDSIGRFLVVAIAAGGLLAWCATADRAANAHAAAGVPAAWEYRQESSVPATDSELLDEEVLRDQQRMLETNGRDGWELASTHTFPIGGGQAGGQTTGGYGVVYVFKRPLR